MSPQEEGRKSILDRVKVTPQMVVVAKAMIFGASERQSDYGPLVKTVLDAQGLAWPEKVILHPSVDAQAAINAAAGVLSWSLASSEAIWALIHANLLLPGPLSALGEPHLGWTTVAPGSGGGESSSWSFPECHLPVPQKVHRAPSSLNAGSYLLSDPDLFLHTLKIPNMHDEVTTALRESVKCFRQDLFTAAVAMLGKASEGAWLELGGSLLKWLPQAHHGVVKKQRATLEDVYAGPMQKVQAVLTLCDRADLFGPIMDASGIRKQELAAVAQWSDLVRDSRNTIHFGVTPAMPNTYEKVAALLLGVAQNMRVIYRLKGTADA
jgi:hypothetical protein